MDIINIQNWSNAQVLQWFKGLDECLHRYEANLKVAEVIGEQLLSLTNDDLHSLQIHLVGHQELVLDAVSLLQQLDYGLDSETLQSRALCLKCRCRGMRSSISTRRREAEEYEYDGGISLQRGATNQLLHLASDVLDEGKQLVLWLDRAPFNAKSDFQITRDKMVQLCYELSVTMQQSVFACVIEDAALNICVEIENCADGVVQSSDSLTIQPVSLEQIHLQDVNPDEGLGLFIKATFEGHHVVTGTRHGSVASRAKKIASGDEVIAVNGKAVIGWTLGSLVAALKEHPHEVSLLMKKRPQVSASASSSNLLALFQKNENERSKLLRTSAPVKRINAQPLSKSSSNLVQHQATRSSSGTWSSYRSHDLGGDASLDTTSGTSSMEMSDRRQSTSTAESNSMSSSRRRSSSTNSNQQSTPNDKSRRSTSRGCIPLINAPLLPEEPASPMDILNIPPPPSEPYTPKSDSLSVATAIQGKPNNRSASPNSLLDIEHRRRYTVIGGSTVDQIWYEEFLAQVNKCNFTPCSGRPSQEQISSSEEVFTNSTPPIRFTSIASLNNHERRNAKLNQRPNKYASRPVSMPPNYYSPVRRIDQPVLQPLTTPLLEEEPKPCRGCQGKPNTSVRDRRPKSNRSSSSHNIERPQPRYYTDTKSGVRHSSYNNNNNNSINGSDADNTNNLTKNSKNPPKPPPRSSSITKLSHRSSADISDKICHSRQSSLPLKTALRVMDDGKQNSLPLQKPYVADKASPIDVIMKVPTRRPAKRLRSSSTPHLHQPRPSPTSQLIGNQLSVSEDKLKSLQPELKYGTSSSRTDHTNTSVGLLNTRNDHSPNTPNHQQIGNKQINETMTHVARPVPKPRTNIRKTPEKMNEDKRQRTNSQDTKSGLVVPVPTDRYRRKSAGHVPQKTKIETILATMQLDGQIDDVSEDHARSPVKWRSRTSPRHSPTTARVSYNAAINSYERYKSSPLNAALVSSDVPQPNDSYELKVIAGVPVRLRKSISRFATHRAKSSSEKGKPNQFTATVTAEMKTQRRVSCRDLGDGDCQGWLWKKKSGAIQSSGGPLSTKWAKRWVVIKDRAIYCYRSNSLDDSEKAECYISLPGYKVAPASECKRKFAFHISHMKRKTFFFAAERQMDMSRWMNKMGLAAIEYQFENKEENDPQRVKDEDYYSESDEESINGRSSNGESELKPRKSSRPHTVGSLTTLKPNGDLRNRCQSESIKRNQCNSTVDDPSSSNTSLTTSEGLTTLPPSPRKKPTVSSDQRRHRGNTNGQRLGSGSSRSLDSLIKLQEDNMNLDGTDMEKYRKAKEMAALRAENFKNKQMSVTSPAITIKTADDTKSTFSDKNLEKRKSSSTFYTTDNERPHSTDVISVNTTMPKLHQSSSSPALTNIDSMNFPSTSSVSRRDAAGRPKIKPAATIDSPQPTPAGDENAPTTKEIAAQLCEELGEDDSIDNLCKTIKQAEVDLRGVNRRITLRRKMTVLSRDPHINERMLRKRALERELKAKELELAYFNKLLNKDKISSSTLNEWVNEHPSLFAELGTIRRMSKKRRPPVEMNDSEKTPLDGDEGPVSPGNSSSSSTPTHDNAVENANNNNRSLLSSPARVARPRSGAIADTDFDYRKAETSPEVHITATRLNSSPASVTSSNASARSSHGRRRKLIPNRSVGSGNTPKPYLETDL